METHIIFKKIGYLITIYSEELGYDEYFVTENQLDSEIQKIKNKAKKIDSISKFDTIYISEVYECIENSEMCNEIDIPELQGKKVIISNKKKKIKIPFSNKAQMFEELTEKIPTKKFSFGIMDFDSNQLIFEDNNNLYIDYYGQIYKVKDKNKFLKIFGEYIE